MPGDVGAIAQLLSLVFGFVVDPEGLAKMKREHKLEVINAAFKIAMDQHDAMAIDLLFAQLRELSASTDS
jgi:hypothetical protein